MFVSCVYMLCVGRGLCDGLITRPEESVCVRSRNLNKEEDKAQVRAIVPQGNINI
jgi:hypothetical protein